MEEAQGLVFIKSLLKKEVHCRNTALSTFYVDNGLTIRCPLYPILNDKGKSRLSKVRRLFQEDFLTNSFQSLFEVRNNVFRSFRPYGKPDEVRPYARLHELLIRQLAVRMAGGMENAGTGVRHMGHDGGQLQTVHELDGTFTASLNAEGYHTTRLATAELLLRQFIILIGRKTG